MKSTLFFQLNRPIHWFLHIDMKRIFITLILIIGTYAALFAQDTSYTKPSWWFGAAFAANFNFHEGSTQRINDNLITSAAFHEGFGIGLYAAPLIEFYRPASVFGFMFQAGYDNRMGKFEQVYSPCNCPRDLSTKLSYISIEPSLRIAPFRNDFYLFAGPRFAYNLNKSFVYKKGTNPDFPDQIAEPDVKGDFSAINDLLISMQVGAGYDIYLTPEDQKAQMVISPFVSFHPYFGQEPRTIETWNITTLRGGAAIKFGKGRQVITDPVVKKSEDVKATANLEFKVIAPENVPLVYRMRETFPLRNYVFFDSNSNSIPDRYVLLNKSEVKDFKEDQLEVFKPKKLSGRSDRQMTVYYNLLNILGDRMQKNPESTIFLAGSSAEDNGLAMAQSVKDYLTKTFEINPSRITIEGRFKPRLPSEQPGSENELQMLRACDRRVTIWSNYPDLLLEFQSGHEAPLKPIEIVVEKGTTDSVIIFKMLNPDKTIYSWSMEIKDPNGKKQSYGPYMKETITIPNNTVLGKIEKGKFNIKMIGLTKNDKTIEKDTAVQLVKWVKPRTEEGYRYSVIYEFNDASSIAMYEKYLTEVVAPKITSGSTVNINGYSDIIGSESYNLTLSQERANDVYKILNNALKALGRSNVVFNTVGNGENPSLAPFANNYPEERFYNRCVIIDVILKK